MKQCNILFKSVAEGVVSNYNVKGTYIVKGSAFQISFYLNDENGTQKYLFSSFKDGSMRLTKSGNSNYFLIFKNNETTDSKMDFSGFIISASIKTTLLNIQVYEEKINIECKYLLTMGGGESLNAFTIELKGV